MRYPIWKSDDFFELAPEPYTRWDMDASVVQLPDEPLPLVREYQFDQVHLGSVSDIRIEDGDITGEVNWFGGHDDIAVLLEQGDMRLGGFYAEVVKQDGVVSACRLNAVSTMANQDVPGNKEE